MQRVTLEAIYAFLFGKRLGALEEPVPLDVKEYITIVTQLFSLMSELEFGSDNWRMEKTPLYNHFVATFNRMVEIGEAQVLEFEKNFLEDMNQDPPPPPPQTVPYFYHLLAARLANPKSPVSRDSIISNLNGLLLGGVDTTSVTLQWLLWNLASFPDKQQKLRNELNSVLKGKDMGPDDMKNLPYLKNTIKESARITPSGAGSVRSLPRSLEVKLGGEISNGPVHILPANIPILLTSGLLHKDSNVYERADEFEPERWEEDRVRERQSRGNLLADHRFVSLPFGFGPKMCIGSRLASVEVSSFICRLLQDAEITKVDPVQKVVSLNKMVLIPFPTPKLDFRQL